jgi:hypothetical protein
VGLQKGTENAAESISCPLLMGKRKREPLSWVQYFHFLDTFLRNKKLHHEDLLLFCTNCGRFARATNFAFRKMEKFFPKIIINFSKKTTVKILTKKLMLTISIG